MVDAINPNPLYEVIFNSIATSGTLLDIPFFKYVKVRKDKWMNINKFNGSYVRRDYTWVFKINQVIKFIDYLGGPY